MYQRPSIIIRLSILSAVTTYFPSLSIISTSPSLSISVHLYPIISISADPSVGTINESRIEMTEPSGGTSENHSSAHLALTAWATLHSDEAMIFIQASEYNFRVGQRGDLNEECIPHRLMYSDNLAPQLIMLFAGVLEPLGSGTLLGEVLYWTEAGFKNL